MTDVTDVTANPVVHVDGWQADADTVPDACIICGLPAVEGYTPEGEARCFAHFLRPTDGPLVRHAVKEMGLPIIGRRKVHAARFCLACEDTREVAAGVVS